MKRLYRIAVMIVFIAGMWTTTHAQQLLNNGNGTIVNNGTIRFINASASFTNNVTGTPITTGTSSGTFEFSGDVAGQVFFGTNPVAVLAYRIPGWTVYSGSGAVNIYGPGQAVNAYYTNLGLTNGTSGNISSNKTFPAVQTHVSGSYIANGGDRDYLTGCATSNIFYYDGTDQTIFPESGSSGSLNRYASMYLTGTGTKTLATTQTAYIKYNFTSDLGANLVDNGNMYVGNENLTCTPSTVAGNVTVSSGNFYMGYNSITYTGDVAVSSGSFTLTNSGNADFTKTMAVNAGGILASTDAATANITIDGTGTATIAATGQLYLGNDNNLYVNGSITNAGDGTNLTFADASDVYYQGSGAQNVMPTVLANSYANLHIENGGIKTLSGDAYVREAFDLGVVSGNATSLVTTASYALIMGGGAADYYAANEITGNMRRDADVGTGTYIMATSTTYNMNNSETQVAFGNLPTGTNNYFQLAVAPGTTPDGVKISAPLAPAADVNRLIVADGTGDLSFLRVAYLTSEANGTTPANVKMVEGYTSTLRGDKMITGTPQTTNNDANFNFVDLIGVNDGANNLYYTAMATGTAPGTTHQLFDNSAIVLTNEELPLISVRNGRWSDPQTWDEGRTPVTSDYALIRHIVYTGIYSAGTTPFGGRDWAADENSLTGVTGNVLANRTRLDVVNTTGNLTGPSIALVIGNNDNTMTTNPTLIFGSATSGTASGLFIDNTTATSLWGESTSSYNNLQGLWVMTPSTITPQARAIQITNVGSVNINSLLEIGQ